MNEKAMQFGIFGGAQAGSTRPGAIMGQGFHDFIDLNVEAEALGYHSTFLVEHHFTGWNQVSAPLTLLTWLAARTRTLRLGTAVIVLPWHNPVLLAEQAATLDLMSGGRLDFGIGKGYRHSEFKGFAVALEEADARFEEALEIILRGWTSKQRFSHRGRFWHFDDIVVEPPPRQQPHPPIWMAAASAQSIRKVAARGFNLMLDQFASLEMIGERLALYRAEVESHGRVFDRSQLCVARDIYVARDESEKRAAHARNDEEHERILSVSRWPNRAGGSHILAYANSEESRANTLIGTAAEITAKLEALRDIGVTYLILNHNGSRESLRRFAHEIMPSLSHGPGSAPSHD
jgi:alkanesulfonate monooxygenase SsuD/methylene tetrahydromethanopterin reductase-like flavin-dependent oxidoreductase (luciferase family)